MERPAKVEIGSPATYAFVGDRYPATVESVEYTKSGKVRAVEIRLDAYTRTDGGPLQSESQRYEISRDPNGECRRFVWFRGHFRGPTSAGLLLGSRECWRDPTL